jgi:hypothetical protein
MLADVTYLRCPEKSLKTESRNGIPEAGRGKAGVGVSVRMIRKFCKWMVVVVA